jgi:ketosteroid isomerase-like protein
MIAASQPAGLHFRRRAAAIAALVSICLSGAAASSAETTSSDRTVTGAVTAALDAAQSGNTAALQREYLPDCTYIDEFAPFVWTGPGSAKAYADSAARMYRETASTDVKASHGAPSFAHVVNGAAYVMVPLIVTAQVHGKPYKATGALAFTLRKTSSGWKISSQTWAKTTESFNPY